MSRLANGRAGSGDGSGLSAGRLAVVGITLDDGTAVANHRALEATIPIFNIPGIAEATYISIFSGVVGAESADAVAAAVFVFRILTWLAPIPFGRIAFTRWRDQVGKRGDVDLLDAFDKPGEEPA